MEKDPSSNQSKSLVVVGICGYKGHGKSSIAKILCDDFGFIELTFASNLKDVVAQMFQWDRKKLDGLTEEDRKWKETVDEWWSIRLSIPNLSPRWVLQNFGTEVVRNHFHPDMWLASLEKMILDMPTEIEKIVISDCRLFNEYDLIMKKMNGVIMFRVHRQAVDMGDNHITESEFRRFDGPRIVDINNNGTLQDLADSVYDELMSCLDRDNASSKLMLGCKTYDSY